MKEQQESRLAMIFRASTTAVSLLAFLGFSSALCTQQPTPPTLHEILERLEANLNHYDTRVPSLYCDEHVLSARVEPGERDQNTITDSVFRLKRTPGPGHTTALAESREIQFVDGKPATSQQMEGPTMLNGAFEGALAVVSLSQTSCMTYALQRINRNRPSDAYIVHFETALTPQNVAGCLLQENSKGRAFIDPASMQITRLEITTPRHTIIRGSPFTSPMIGRRDLAVDYSSVLLGGETFWMPSTITMRSVSGAGTFHMSVWSFKATYRNYHKLEVTSRILPGMQPTAP
jgi:hypothetical protein